MSSAPLTEKTFIARQDDLLKRIAGLGVDCVLAFGFGSALGGGTVSHGALRYLSGWDGHESLSLLAVSGRERLLLVGSPFLQPLAERSYRQTGIAAVPTRDWGAFLRARFGASASFGTVGFGEMPQSIHAGLESALPEAKLLEIDSHVDRMRLRKTREELALHEAGAAICDLLFASLAEEFRSKRRVWEIQLALETRAKLAGADYCKTWLTVAPCADYPRYWPSENANVPSPGDQALFGVALTVSGYWAHGLRMGSVGPARDDHKRLCDLVNDMLDAGAACLETGRPVSSAELEMDRLFRASTQDLAGRDIARFRNGHALGTSYEDPLGTEGFPQHFGPPAFRQAMPSDLRVEPAMVFELHPNLFVRGIGGAVVGDMIVTTAAEPRRLLAFPRDIVEL